MKRTKRWVSMLTAALTAAFCLLTAPIPAAAAGATATIRCSNASPTVGSTVTVTVTFSGADFGTINALLRYDAARLELIPGGDVGKESDGTAALVSGSLNRASSYSFPVNFRAKQAGRAQVRLDYDGMRDGALDYETEEVMRPAASATLDVIAPTASGNANLASLKISAGTLSPRFSANTTTYRVTVPYAVSTLVVTATAADAGAKVSLGGSNSLKVGENVRTVVVTAPSGATKTYTIRIVREAQTASNPTASTGASSSGTSSNAASSAESDPLAVEWNNADYFVADDWSDVDPPVGFSVTELTYHGETVPAAQSADGSLFLLYLLRFDRSGGSFYCYDPEQMAFSAFRQLILAGTAYTLLEPPLDFTPPAGYVAAERTVGEQTVTAFVFPGQDEDFCLVYAMAPGGNRGLYSYDAAERTLQRYAALPTAPDVVAQTEAPPTLSALLADPRYRYPLLIGAALLLLAGTACAVILALRRRAARAEAEPTLFSDAFGQSGDELYPTDSADFPAASPDAFPDEPAGNPKGGKHRR